MSQSDTDLEFAHLAGVSAAELPLLIEQWPADRLLDVIDDAAPVPLQGAVVATIRPEFVAAPVLDCVRRATAGEALSEAERRRLVRGLLILGAARYAPAGGSVLAMLRALGNRADDLLGYAMFEELQRVLAGLYDDDADGFAEALMDPGLGTSARAAMVTAMAFLTWCGRFPRALVHDLLARIGDERQRDNDEQVWVAWELAAETLGLRSLAPRVMAALEDGRIPASLMRAAHYWKGLEAAERGPGDPKLMNMMDAGYIEDVYVSLQNVDTGLDAEAFDPTDIVGDLGNWTGYAEPVRNPLRNVGRNDPCPCGSGKKYKKCCLV